MKLVKSLMILGLLIVISISNKSLAQNIWEPAGIGGGSVSTIVKVNEPVFIAGYVGGGLYRSTNAGESWYSISNQIDNVGVFVIKKSPSGDIYVGTQRSVYQSTDDGINWNKVNNSFPQNGYAEDITFDASGNVYVANNYNGIYKSTDGGNSWIQINSGFPLSKYIYRVNFTSNNILIASDFYRGIYKSTDFGANWVQSNSGLDTTFYINSISSNTTGDIFITTAGNGPMKSTDDGNNWESIKGDLTLLYNSDIDFTSTGDLYLTVVQQLYKSTNGGTNWTNITTMFNGLGFQGSYVDNNDNIWSATLNSGVIKSSDGGINWNTYQNGLTSTLIQSLVADASGNLFAAIPGKGLYSSFDNGDSWNKITITNNEEDTFIKTVEVLPEGGLIVYNVYNGMNITSDLSSWNSFNNGLTNQAIQELAVSNDYYFAAGWDGKIFRSPKSAADWVEITDTSLSGYCYDLFVSSAGDLYYLFDQDVYKSSDNGDNWVNVGSTIDGYSFSITQNSFGDIFVGTDYGVYRSTNAGSSWIEDVSGLTDGALSLAIFSTNNVFAGGYASVSWSNDFGQNWVPFTTGIENCRVTNLVFGHSDVLCASIENMGIYRTTSAITSVDENKPKTVSDFMLEQNYPNPFNPSTKISWHSPVNGHQTLKVYDVLGNEIATLVNEVNLPEVMK